MVDDVKSAAETWSSRQSLRYAMRASSLARGLPKCIAYGPTRHRKSQMWLSRRHALIRNCRQRCAGLKKLKYERMNAESTGRMKIAWGRT